MSHVSRTMSSGVAIGALVASTFVLAMPAQAVPGPAAASPAQVAQPDFGPNVTIFDPSTPVDEINATLASLSTEAEFSLDRHAVFFLPGTYGDASGQNDPSTATGIVNAELGYYTSIAGLGASPEDVRINGALHVEAVQSCPTPWTCQSPGSLTRFWRSMSNLTINPIQRPIGEDATRANPEGVADPHTLRFAVSQAAPLRRVNIEGDLSVFGRFGGYASGGYLANSKVDGTVITGSQQQWYTRDSEVGAWDGGVWNMVFSGVQGAPPTDFAPGNKTTLDTTPVTREAPFLYLNGDEYAVFVPKAGTDTRGVNWSTSSEAGESVPIDDFYIAHEGDSAQTINAAVASGKNLLLTPGVYELDEAIHVDNPDTVVLGIGYPTLTPTDGTAALEVGDVAGVKIAGITVDANVVNSDVLVKIGPDDAAASTPDDPTTLNDVFIRVGGAWAGRATTSIEVNSPGVLLDHIWAWRADHGNPGSFGWDVNTGDHGLVVNGDDVTATGLFVEHYQKNQTVWNGEGGTMVFYQSELPYDPPSQAAWMDGARNGYASYRVSDAVATHSATGLGIYSYFERGIPILLESAIQTPRRAGVDFTSMTTVFLNGSGGISHIVNDAGDPAIGSFASPQLAAYPAADTTAPVVTANGTDPVTLSATDEPYGVATIEYSLGSAVATDASEWKAYTQPVAFTPTARVLSYRATDGFGNVSAIGSVNGPALPKVASTTVGSANRLLLLGNQPLTYSVTVSGRDGVVPTGQVDVYDGIRKIDTLTLDATGKATKQLTVGRGLHLLTAHYLGDARLTGSVGWPSLVIRL